MEGDLLKDPIPDGHDLVLLANVNHLLSPEHNIELLRRIRDGRAWRRSPPTGGYLDSIPRIPDRSYRS